MTESPTPVPGRELDIEHTYADGTVLNGTRREDDLYAMLRSHGWNYRRSCGDFRLQASQDRPAKRGAIARTAAALRERGFVVTTRIDTAPRAVEQAETERAGRAEERADRLHATAARRAGEAERRERAANQVLDNIPLGQPYLTDHSGYRADRNRRERAFANMDRAVQLSREARELENAAQTAAGHMRYRQNPDTVVNRIRDFEAELRGIGRHRTQHAERERLLTAGVPPERIGLTALSLEAATILDEREVYLTQQLDYWRTVRAGQVADGTATGFGRDDVTVGDLVLYRDLWLPVVRTNAKSVSVPKLLLSGATTTVRYEHIADLARVDDPRRAELAVAAVARAEQMLGTNQRLHCAWLALVPAGSS